MNRGGLRIPIAHGIRDEVERRLITGESHASISRALSINPSTVRTWDSRRGRPRRRASIIRIPSTETQQRTVIPSELTFEHLLAVVPDTEVLGEILLTGIISSISKLQEKVVFLKERHEELAVQHQGVMASLAQSEKELKAALTANKSLSNDTQKLRTSLNEKTFKSKIRKIGIDQVRHVFIPKA